MPDWLKLAPLVILLVGVAVIVWRSLRRDSDGTHNNRNIGGGPGDGGGLD